MQTLDLIITDVSYGRDILARRHPQPVNKDEIANTVYIYAEERDTYKGIGFRMTLQEFAALENKDLIIEGEYLRFDVGDAEEEPPEVEGHASYGSNDYTILSVHRSNCHDVHVQISEFPKDLSGSDPIDTVYEIKGTLVGGAEAGKEVTVHIRKDNFIRFTQPADKSVWSFHPLKLLSNDDALVFLEEGDCLTFKSCMQTDEDTYESLGRMHAMRFDANVTFLSQSIFHKDPRFKYGYSELKVMFNTSYLIGRVCKVGFDWEEQPDFAVGSTLKVKGGRKSGIGNPPHIVADTVEPM